MLFLTWCGDQARTRISEREKSNRNGWESYRYVKNNDVMKTKKGYEDITDNSIQNGTESLSYLRQTTPTEQKTLLCTRIKSKHIWPQCGVFFALFETYKI